MQDLGVDLHKWKHLNLKSVFMCWLFWNCHLKYRLVSFLLLKALPCQLRVSKQLPVFKAPLSAGDIVGMYMLKS